jgi:hypothetical protein
MWVLALLFVLLGSLWLVLGRAEKKAADAARADLSSLSNAELVVRVKDALRSGNSVDVSTNKLREDDGYRRD